MLKRRYLVADDLMNYYAELLNFLEDLNANLGEKASFYRNWSQDVLLTRARSH